MFAAGEKAAVNKHAGFHVNMNLLFPACAPEDAVSGRTVIAGLVLREPCTLSLERPCVGAAGWRFL